jgi:Protein of unknown function (DUF3618)
MNQRTASDIERDLDHTRAEMGQTIDALQERLSPGQLFEQALGYFSSGSGRSMADGAAEFTQNFGRAIRDNPIPFALVTTGLVWLMLARSRRSPAYETYQDYEDYESFEGYEDYSDYPVVEEPAEETSPARYGSADATLDPAERERDLAEHPSAMPAGPGLVSQGGGLPPRGGLGGSVGAASVSEQRAQEAVRQAGLASGTERREHDEEATRRAREAADEARRQADLAGGGTGGRGRADVARGWAGEKAHEARQRMQRAAEGTRRGFGRAGRSARRQAQDAASSTRHRISRAGGTLTHLFEERPLLVGAIGLAIGAALGAALPTTRREDEWLGETRDNLKHRAREELGKAQRVAERTYESARDEVERQHLTPEDARHAAWETVQEAQHAAEERIREAARDAEHLAEDKLKDVESRLRKVGEAATEAAKEEAERQNLGGGFRSSGSDQPGPDPTGHKQA